VAFEAGDVVRVPFPYTDRPVRQHRPALVISSGPVGPKSSLIWVLMITSAENPRWAGDVDVAAGSGSGLPVPSLVRSAKIATIDAAAAQRIGRAPAEVLRSAREHVQSVLR